MGKRSAAANKRRNRKRGLFRHRLITAPITRTAKQKTRSRYVTISTGKGKIIISYNCSLRIPVYSGSGNKRVRLEDTVITLRKRVLNVTEVKKCYRIVAKYLGKYWTNKKDRLRSTRPLFILGVWTALGHSKQGDEVYLAGSASKSLYYKAFIKLLQPFTAKAEDLLREFRPDLVARIEKLDPDDRPLGLFTLVMAAKGSTLFHKDRNDLVSVMFLLKKNGKGGQFDVGETDYMFNQSVGDAIIMDGSAVVHGNRKFMGSLEDRLILLFIVHKTVLEARGV